LLYTIVFCFSAYQFLNKISKYKDLHSFSTGTPLCTIQTKIENGFCIYYDAVFTYFIGQLLWGYQVVSGSGMLIPTIKSMIYNVIHMIPLIGLFTGQFANGDLNIQLKADLALIIICILNNDLELFTWLEFFDSGRFEEFDRSNFHHVCKNIDRQSSGFDEESGDEESGDEESGDEESGDEESCDEESCDEESCDEESGDEESCDEETTFKDNNLKINPAEDYTPAGGGDAPAVQNPEKFEDAINRVIQQGLRITTLSEFRKEDERADYKVWEFEREVSPDMPWPDPITIPEFDTYNKQILQHPKFNSNSWFFVMDGDQITGLNNLWKSEIKDVINTGLTGVHRKYRRKGVATALKHISLTWAKNQGYKWIRTDNAATNEGMLNINIKVIFTY
jgi:GNAT superfamily N-acetyltransferase